MNGYDRRLLRGLLACLLGLQAHLALAQATKTAPKGATSEEKTLITRDGEQIRCTYFRSTAGKSAPVAILLHGKNGHRKVWETGAGNLPGFAQALQSNDFAVITVDLRGHGENISSQGAPAANKKGESVRLTPRHYQAMVAEDLEAVKRFLLEEHEKGQLNIRKLAIVGAEFSTAVALAYFELDWSKKPWDDSPVPGMGTPRGQDVRALVLLSPESTVPGLVTTAAATAIRNLRGRVCVMIGVGTKDNLDRGTAKKLAEQISPRKEEGDSQYLFLEEYDTKFRGTDMLLKGLKVEQHMYRFLDEKVKKFEVEWRTRKSPLMD
jgi:pimeloyl-ACP methyl ester carboxylesterase